MDNPTTTEFFLSEASASIKPNRDIRQYADIDPRAKSTLDTAAARLDISARSYMKVVKVAHTIADLEQHSTISTVHTAGALQYRRQEVVPAL